MGEPLSPRVCERAAEGVFATVTFGGRAAWFVVWLGCLFLLKKDMRAKSEMTGEFVFRDWGYTSTRSASANSASPASCVVMAVVVVVQEGKAEGRWRREQVPMIVYPLSSLTPEEEKLP